ncbi:MAG: cobalt-precorrin-5B (C(1))-methyltransferase [Lachnospiraceae bacterium]
MSEKAIVDTIETEIRQRAAAEKRTSAYTWKLRRGYVSEYLQLDMDSSVKCSNYIGETIDLAVSYGMERILLVGNIGSWSSWRQGS